ncbi:hypothetical protein BS17DRAFT_764361 [Gyrodon lividus]|nr:hypothetical protein BS17DRAFT_764361 [Gyrodon lividus]
MMIWILNRAHHTPSYCVLGLAKEIDGYCIPYAKTFTPNSLHNVMKLEPSMKSVMCLVLARFKLEDAGYIQSIDVNHFDLCGGGNQAPGVPFELSNDERDQENPLKQEVQRVLEQMYFDILQESPNKKSHTQGAWTNIPSILPEQLAVEDLYLQPEQYFVAVQYKISSEENWEMHFNQFFPSEVPMYAGQNFGKACHYRSYLNLMQHLSKQQLGWV